MRASLLGGLALAVAACGTLQGATAVSDDGGAPPDAGASDANDAGTDGTAPPFCAQHTTAFVCSDFDDPAKDVGSGWDRIDTTAADVDGGAADVTFDDAVSVSAPRSMRAHFISFVGDGKGARLVRMLPADAHHVRVSFAMMLDAITTSSQLTVAEIFWDNCGTPFYQGEWLVVNDRNLSLYVDGSAVTTKFATLPPGMFSQIVLDADWTQSPASVRVTVDGQAAASSLAALAPCAGKGEFRVSIGFGAQSPGETTAHYDDVVVEIVPTM